MGSNDFSREVMSTTFSTRGVRARKFRPLSARTTATRAGRSRTIISRGYSATRKPAFNSLRQFLAINSWPVLLANWRVWKERTQRAALRDIADDPHLL